MRGNVCLGAPGVTSRGRPVRHMEPSHELENRVMVLYTGGTIGMRMKDGVYVPEANYLPKAIRGMPQFNDVEYVKRHYSDVEFQPMVLPPVKGEDRRILYWMFEYEPILDSCNVTFDDWIRIAKDIMANYEEYDAFLVLHGTDTLCYTASALSFMFENLGKAIIVTGSQIPLCEVRSDGRENFIGGLIAANYDIPEVLVYFNSHLFRGNRCRKLDSEGLDAFGCPNFPPIAEMGVTIDVAWDEVFRSEVPQKVTLHTKMNRHVGLLRIFPSITIECIRTFLQKPIEGVVLQTFGAGNMPSNRPDILEAFKKATDRGVIIINCTQCEKGNVAPHYATGQILIDAGVLPGADMTPEAALTKLAYVLGIADWNIEKKRKMMGQNLRGELSIIKHPEVEHSGRVQRLSFAWGDFDLVKAFTDFMRATSSEETHIIKKALVPPIICHAAAAGDLDILESLKTQLKANLSQPDYDNRTALHVAAGTGNVEVVKFLLKSGASVHARDRWNETPLINAVKNCNFECIDILVTAGAHLTAKPVAIGMELCMNAGRRDLDKLKAWKRANVDFNIGDYDRRTALHIASSKGYLAIVEYLLEQGADPQLEDNFGRTAVDEAEAKKDKDLIKLLEQKINNDKK